MSKIKAAVVIPIYKDELNEFEKISLNRVLKVLGRYPIIFFAPEGKKFSYVPKDRPIIYFQAGFFKNLWTYNALMLEKNFYTYFFDFDYILIYQLDAFVFSDKLEYFCSLGYDYIGAAWPYTWGTLARKNPNIENKKIILRAGNGGFCLRKPKAIYDLLKKKQNLAEKWRCFSEDTFFAYCGMNQKNKFKVAPVKIATKFSIELLAEHFYKKNNQLPFGCHAWQKLSADFYFNVFKNFGIDLTELKSKMRSEDFVDLENLLKFVAWSRFFRKIKRNESISDCLQKKFYDSVFAIKTQNLEIVLQKILSENKFSFNNIVFYEKNDINSLIEGLQKNEENILVIEENFFEEDKLISELKKNNFQPKENVEFFHANINKHYEKIFHNLGK